MRLCFWSCAKILHRPCHRSGLRRSWFESKRSVRCTLMEQMRLPKRLVVSTPSVASKGEFKIVLFKTISGNTFKSEAKCYIYRRYSESRIIVLCPVCPEGFFVLTIPVYFTFRIIKNFKSLKKHSMIVQEPYVQRP